MNKKLLLVVVILLPIVLLLAGILGFYVFASSQKHKAILKLNIREIATNENTASYTLSEESTGKTTFNIPFIYGDQALSDETPTKTTVVVDVENNTVTKTDVASGQIETTTLEKYNETEGLVTNLEVWEKVIDRGDFEVEETELNGKKMWKYTIDHQDITDDYMQILRNTVQDSFESNEEGQEVLAENVNVEFEGVFTFVFYVRQDDNLVERIDSSTTAPMTITFDLAGKTIDDAVAALTAAGQPVPSTTSTMKFENIVATSTITESKEKEDAETMPTNPILLFIGARQD